MILFQNVSLSLDKIPILKAVSCSIPEGKTTTIIGKSGSGKTVLMKTLLGLFIPDSGIITIGDKEIFGNQGFQNSDKRLAMVFQGAALLDSLTVYQNIALPIMEHQSSSINEVTKQVKNALHLVGLHDVEDLSTSSLSGGMKKRVGLARALVLAPDILIYDEPTTGLDPLTADEIISLMASVQQAKPTMTSIIITHDPQCINRVAEFVVMIDQGRIIFQGDRAAFDSTVIPEIVSFKHFAHL